MVLMICTGNTCRSPMAELLLQKRLATELDCDLESLHDRGVEIMSAGIAAQSGGRPSPEAVSIMQEYGLDLSSHMSQPMSERVVRHADLILTMTRSHRDMLLHQWPEAVSRTRLLCVDTLDISDPIGGSIDVYRSCANQIDNHLKEQVQRLDLQSLIGKIVPQT